jgi:hypothetical protein
VEDLGMALVASVETTKVKRENTTVIEADKNGSFDSVLLVRTPFPPTRQF